MAKIFRPFEIFRNQETLLSIWLNGDSSAETKHWRDIWNGSTYRVATDGGLNKIEPRFNILYKPNYVCGDFDSIENLEEKRRQFHLIDTPDQDRTDLHKTIDFCLEQKMKSWNFERIVLLGGLNGRFDHTMATLSTLTRFSDLTDPIFVLDSKNLVFALPVGESKIIFELERCTRICGVIPLVQSETIVSSEGLKWDLDDTSLRFGELISTSNEITSSTVVLKTNNPILFTLEMKL